MQKYCIYCEPGPSSKAESTDSTDGFIMMSETTNNITALAVWAVGYSLNLLTQWRSRGGGKWGLGTQSLEVQQHT